jgi:hypothetical protein
MMEEFSIESWEPPSRRMVEEIDDPLMVSRAVEPSADDAPAVSFAMLTGALVTSRFPSTRRVPEPEIPTELRVTERFSGIVTVARDDGTEIAAKPEKSVVAVIATFPNPTVRFAFPGEEFKRSEERSVSAVRS